MGSRAPPSNEHGMVRVDNTLRTPTAPAVFRGFTQKASVPPDANAGARRKWNIFPGPSLCGLAKVGITEEATKLLGRPVRDVPRARASAPRSPSRNFFTQPHRQSALLRRRKASRIARKPDRFVQAGDGDCRGWDLRQPARSPVAAARSSR